MKKLLFLLLSLILSFSLTASLTACDEQTENGGSIIDDSTIEEPEIPDEEPEVPEDTPTVDDDPTVDEPTENEPEAPDNPEDNPSTEDVPTADKPEIPEDIPEKPEDTPTTDDEPTHVHIPGNATIENKVAADCESAGSYDEVVYCADCEAELSREAKTIAIRPHTPASAVVENKVDADCENAGSYDEVVYCADCEAELSREKKDIPAQHNLVNNMCTLCDYVKYSEGLEMTLSEDATYYIVTELGECTDTDIMIPKEHKGLPVKELGEYAFYFKNNITSVTIPEGVTKISASAFDT